MINSVKQRKPEKNLPSAILSTTNHTQNYLGANPGLRAERLATNHLSHGTAKTVDNQCNCYSFLMT
jgi:hypothetical protein